MAPKITPPTSNDDRPPDIKSIVWRFVSRYFKGRPAIVIYILLSLTAASWFQWDKVRQLPGIKNAVVWLSQEAVPQADPNRFAVAVAHIEDDQGREVEKLITEALKEFDGIQPLNLDGLIPLEGAYPEDMEKRGHAKAREHLKRLGAQVLIWGRVIRTSGKSVPKLYWTTSEDLGQARSYGRYQPTENLHLPAIFWEDLAEILRLLAATQSAQFYSLRGRYIGDQIGPFIERVRHLLNGSEDKPGWSREALALMWFILGDSLIAVGDQKGQNHAFVEAIQAYQEALKAFNRERAPLAWAMTQNNLGNAFLRLGERESGTTRLEQAASAHREALKERTRERAPLAWAMTQSNLGDALARLGQRHKNVGLACEALEKHCLAWETFYHKASYYASQVEEKMKADLSLLERSFSSATYKACVQRHIDTLNRVKRQKPSKVDESYEMGTSLNIPIGASR